jgi:DNA recombination protein RmuC
LLTPVRESLQRFNDRLTEVEKERVAMSTDLRNQVSEVRLTGETLRRETAALVTALRKPQVRGAWGELQLKRVVELAGMVEHCDFVQQQTTQTSSGATIRPDLKVTLTEGRFVYVDSKVPLSAFLDAQQTEDAAERNRSLALFARNVQTHVDQLSRKDYYKADGGGTPEFVVLFLASEALAAEAFNQLPSLLEYAADRSVMLATPSSLIAMLKTIAFSWRQAALAESAQEVFSLGRELYDRLGTLGKHFDKVGRSLTSAVGAYNEAVGSIEGRVFPAARKLRDLQVVEKELAAVRASEAAVRPLTTVELVEDAVGVTPMIGRGRAAEELALTRQQPELDDLLSAEVSLPRKGDAQTA